MLLNKLPCLDKGYVAYVDSSGNTLKLKDIALELFKNSNPAILYDVSTLTLLIKCPLFLQLNMSTHNFTIIAVPPQAVEAYCPNVGEIGGRDHEANMMIADDLAATTEAILINPRAYQADGCDRFISQVLTPVSVYTTLLVHGSYNEWRKFTSQKNLPASMATYAETIKQILIMEWK